MFSTARRRVTRPSWRDTPKEVVRLVRMRTPRRRVHRDVRVPVKLAGWGLVPHGGTEGHRGQRGEQRELGDAESGGRLAQLTPAGRGEQGAPQVADDDGPPRGEEEAEYQGSRRQTDQWSVAPHRHGHRPALGDEKENHEPPEGKRVLQREDRQGKEGHHPQGDRGHDQDGREQTQSQGGANPWPAPVGGALDRQRRSGVRETHRTPCGVRALSRWQGPNRSQHR